MDKMAHVAVDASEKQTHLGLASTLRWNRVGALLSYLYRVPHCVPYWSSATYYSLFRSIMSGNVIKGQEVEYLTEILAQFFKVPTVIPCGSGRLALELALRATGLSQGGEVVIPTFCCTGVIPPILAVGAVPVLADVGDELNLTKETVEAALTSKTQAVIVPHLFGNPAEIEAIAELVRGRGIAVIDDAAQAFGAKLNGRALGTFGDAGIVSFGNGKVCFGIGGGALISQSHEILNRAQSITLKQGNALEGISNALSTLLWRRWRRWLLPLKVVISRLCRTEEGIRSYSRETMRNLEAAVALTLVETLEQNLRARRACVVAYQRLLAREPGVTLIPHRSGSAYLTQVVQFEEKHKAEPLSKVMIKTLRAGGYEVKGSYIPLHLLPEHRQYARRQLTNAEKVWANLIELPCEPEVPKEAVENICQLIRKVMKTC